LLPAAGARLHRVRTGRHGQLDVPAAGLDPHRFRLRGGQLDVARAALRGQLPTAQVAPGDLPAPGPHDDVALDVRQPDVPRTGAHLHATADVLELHRSGLDVGLHRPHARDPQVTGAEVPGHRNLRRQRHLVVDLAAPPAVGVQ